MLTSEQQALIASAQASIALATTSAASATGLISSAKDTLTSCFDSTLASAESIISGLTDSMPTEISVDSLKEVLGGLGMPCSAKLPSISILPEITPITFDEKTIPEIVI